MRRTKIPCTSRSARVLFSMLLLISSSCICRRVNAQLTIAAGTETSKENFSWSIAGNSDGQNPNIYSELIYNPIYSGGFHVSAGYKFLKRASIKSEYKQLFTYKGSATDFDYNGDNRTDPEIELFLKSNKGNINLFKNNIYYHMMDNKLFLIAVGCGYKWAKELFYLLNDADPTLKTTYKAKWDGPELALSAKWKSNYKLFIGGEIGYGLLNYRATANWNNIKTFQHPVSFIQNAKGHGWDYNMNIGYRLNDHFSFSVDKMYSTWNTKYGSDILFLATGENRQSRMNGALKKSNGWRTSVFFTF